MERRAEPGAPGDPPQPPDRLGLAGPVALGPHPVLVRGPLTGRGQSRAAADGSMRLLSAVRDMRNFGARHLVSKPHPGLSHTEPKGFVSVDLRSARHHYTPLDQLCVSCDFHCRIPLSAAPAADLSNRVRQRFDPQMAECGRGRLKGDETSLLSNGTIRLPVLTARRSARSAARGLRWMKRGGATNLSISPPHRPLFHSYPQLTHAATQRSVSASVQPKSRAACM